MASSGADLLAQGDGGRKRDLIDSLTGLRALAALWVLALHYSIVADYPREISRFTGHGRAGVSLFFVLSGLVLTLNYRKWFESDTSRWRRFARARVARIAPMYIVGLALGTVATLAAFQWQRREFRVWMKGDTEGPQAVGAWLLHLTGLHAWVPSLPIRDLVNPPDWSVANEVFFYACFPLLMVVLVRRVRSVRGALVLGASVLALQAALVIGLMLYAHDRYQFGDGYHHFRLLHYQLPLSRLPEFVVGCLLGLLCTRVPRLVGDAGRRARDALVLGAIAWIVLVVYIDEIIDPVRGGRTEVVLANLRVHVLFVPGFAALLFAVTLGPTFVHRFLEHSWLQALGLASYTLYVIHFPILQPLVLEQIGRGANPPLWQPALVFAFTIALSLVLHRVIEVPARTAILRWRRPPTAVATAPAG